MFRSTFAELRDIAFASDEFRFACSNSLVELDVDLVELEVGEVEFVDLDLNCS